MSSPSSPPAGPLAVRDGCWMVGHRNPSSLLQCNTYVRTFPRGSRPVHVCVDPGSQCDYHVVEANIRQLLGDVGELHSFSLNHQDPDVVGNAYYLCHANPNISVMVTEEVWRLAQHLRFQPGRVHFANAVRSEFTIIGDQHRWQLVPTPFCHFRGAMAFYDPELRILYSGDLFGGLNQPGRVHWEAEAADWTGIAQFHQIYMPSREALRYAVRRIRALRPAVEVIAPQHGHLITGDRVPLFLEKMDQLLVGLDLFALENDERMLERYGQVLRRAAERAADLLGHEEAWSRLRDDELGDELAPLIEVGPADLRVVRDGAAVIVRAFGRWVRREPEELANALRGEILAACSELDVPIPPIGAGVTEEASPDIVGPDGIQTQAWWLR